MSSEAVTQPLAATQQLAPPLEPGTSFGPYRILGLLGEGGMGQVYQAVQGTLERLVALKVMRPELAKDPQFAERFVREARAAASVCHQHVTVIFDAGEQDGRLYMAFQFVPGGDLDALLRRRTAMPAAEALALIAGCCEGLQAIHEAGLVHRDIKPHNIFLDEQGRPKLGDFGLARQAEGSDRMTLTGVGMGTPSYMAPEQAQGLADIDIRADLHALGGTLFTLLTGKPPFTGLTPWMVVNAVCNDPAPDPRAMLPALPEPVAAIVLRCMAKRREERYQTPLELRDDALRVRAALTGEPLAAGPLPALPQAGAHPFLRRQGWPWAAVGAAALLLLPAGLGPLLAANDRYRPDGWGSAWWAGWLSCVAVEALLVWALVDPRRQDRRVLAVPWIATALAAGLAIGFAGAAIVTAADGRGSGWEAFARLFAWAAGLAALGWLAGPWWRRDALLPRIALPRALALSAAALLVTLICHLSVADRRSPTTAQEESSNAWTDFKRALGGSNGNASQAQRATGAATALAWLAPLTLLLVVPTILARRRR